MIELKEHEVVEAFANLKRAIRRGDDRSAVRLVQNLLSSQDPVEVWKMLLETASSGISYTDQQTAIFVRTLYENWMLDHSPIFAVHAVLALVSAPKGTSANDYLSPRVD